MKQVWACALGLLSATLAGAQMDEGESAALASLTLPARMLAEQGGSRQGEESLVLSPGGRVAGVLNFPAQQVYTFILMARGEAEPWPTLEVRLNTNVVYAAHTSSNWSSYAFTQTVPAGRQEVVLVNRPGTGPGAPTNALQIASLTVMAPSGVPAPVLVTNTAVAVAVPVAPTNAPVAPTNTPVVVPPRTAPPTNAVPAATNAAPTTKSWDAPVGR